ncbi:von Willebrand factor type A domain protein [Dictyocaulus viviparus]|uniref:von Willebrand factor type A domain protein n=1 Tax=Dictyocaulus viviparus TaxID=29172 RepID=A0A0D8X9B1_DICVI|nr:von Willebrand factor type A domain protein [Dictyocaulus viviparus]
MDQEMVLTDVIINEKYLTNATKSDKKKDVSDFENLMHVFREIGEENGVVCPADVLFVLDGTGSMHDVFKQCLEYILKVSGFFKTISLTISETLDRVGVILYSNSHNNKEKIPLGSIDDPEKLAEAVKGRLGIGCIGIEQKHVNYTCHFFFHIETATVHHIETVTDDQGRILIPIPSQIDFSGEEASGEDGSGYDSTNIIYDKLESSGWNGWSNLRIADGSGSLPCEISNIQKEMHVLGIEGSSIPMEINDTDGSSYSEIEGSNNNAESYNYGGSTDSFRDDFIDETINESGLTDGIFESVDGELGVKRNVNNFSTTAYCQYDIVFVFDASGSLQGRFEDQLEIANRLVDILALGSNDTQIAVIKYAGRGKTRVIFNFKDMTNREEIKHGITKTQFSSGTTYTNEALMKAASLFSSSSTKPNVAKPVTIVFTDGFSVTDPSEGARLLQKMGVMVFAIGIDKDGQAINRDELVTIAGHPSRVYTMSNIVQFEKELRTVSEKCRKRKNYS